MIAAENIHQNHLLTPSELAACIKIFREMRKWSQEQLSTISGLNVRTIQRVEQGEPSSLDTRRAIARAFDFEDIDVFDKPFTIPTEEELKAENEKFKRENVTLTATPLTTGKQLAKLVETCKLDMSEPAFDLPRAADMTFAALVDYLRDYRDCASIYEETEKFTVYDEMQSYINQLKSQGVSLRYAIRNIRIKVNSEPTDNSMPATVLYLVAFPLGKEPEQFATPKEVRISF